MNDLKQNMHDKDWEAITRYLGNEMDETEKQEFEKWLELKENKIEFEKISKIWELSSQKEAALFPEDSAWNKFNKRITTVETDPKIVKPNFIRIISRIAATLLILMFSAYLATTLITKTNFVTVTANNVSKETKVILPDSSVVYLNSGTSLTYPKKFGTQTRNISLTGEAFFEVQHNEKLPFVIKTNYAQIKVLGTSFNVYACKNTDSIQVAVATGIVELTPLHGTNKLLIHKGKTGVFNENEQKLKLSENDINTTAWHTKRIVFKQSNLEYIAKTLERLYKTKIDLDNENLKSCRLNADYNVEELSKILQAIEISLKVKLEKTNQGYLITGDGC